MPSAGCSSPDVAPGFIAFTICSRNFLAQAQVLHEGLRTYHPGTTFYLILCDDTGGVDLDALPFEVIAIDRLGIPSLKEMIARYNITELNTATKPFAFLSIFDRHPGSAVAYFDPDILVASRLEELEERLRAGADCVLTPHLCEPAEFAEMDEGKMLQYGIYNLGFCALRDTPQVRRVVAWWGRRLETQCVIDLPAGLFVDQKWADLLPAFVEKTVILRHPGYNVAYWNLAQRTVRAAAGNGGWQVNAEPLRFFHFSGSVVDEPVVFSRHSHQFRFEGLRDVAVLFDRYVALLNRFGRREYRAIPYAFSWDGAAGVNEHTPSSVREAVLARGGRPSAAGLGPGIQPPRLPLLRARSHAEFRAAKAAIAAKIDRRWTYETKLVPHAARDIFEVHGRCVVCGTRQPFRVGLACAAEKLPDGRPIPNWREHLECPGCGFRNRIRAALHVLFQELCPARDTRIFVTEQVTPLYRWLRDHFAAVTGSEYLGPGKEPGQLVQGVRHEDLQRLSFTEASFELIMSFDVLEHVPDERLALLELWRCLRPGGTLLFSVPFRDDVDEHDVRAVLNADGSIEHRVPPEYHGNPLDPEAGSLCFRYYGWRLIDDLREAGFEEPEVLFYWSAEFAYLGTTNSVFIARKPRPESDDPGRFGSGRHRTEVLAQGSKTGSPSH